MSAPTHIKAGDIEAAVLNDGAVSVTILSLGCITQDWRVPLNGARVPVVLGYERASDYRDDPYWMGAIVGRVANRISGAAFTLDGRTYPLAANEGANSLHGGAHGLGRRIWAMERDGARAVRLRLRSPDGDMGFPGAVEFAVTISLTGHRLHYAMTATCERPTPINLAQHSYYNLMGGGPVAQHRLKIAAQHFTPTDRAHIPTGDIAPLDGTRFDFRRERRIGAADPDSRGIDANLVLDADMTTPCVTLRAPNGLGLRLWSDQPGLQVYTARHLRAGSAALTAGHHGAFGAVCLEPQHFPDAVNRPEFPSAMASPDRPYKQELSVEISQEAGL